MHYQPFKGLKFHNFFPGAEIRAAVPVSVAHWPWMLLNSTMCLPLQVEAMLKLLTYIANLPEEKEGKSREGFEQDSDRTFVVLGGFPAGRVLSVVFPFSSILHSKDDAHTLPFQCSVVPTISKSSITSRQPKHSILSLDSYWLVSSTLLSRHK